MIESKKYKVLVTQLEVANSFLKVFLRNISQRTEAAAKTLKYLHEKEPINKIELGEFCIANISKSRYERCRVIQMNKVAGTAIVSLYDTCHQKEMLTSQLRPLRDTELREAEPFCQEYILAEVSLLPNTPQHAIKNFTDMLVGNDFTMFILNENEAGKFVVLHPAGDSLSGKLITEHPEFSKILQRIPLEKQMSLMLQIEKDKEKLCNEQEFDSPQVIEDSLVDSTNNSENSWNIWEICNEAFDEAFTNEMLEGLQELDYQHLGRKEDEAEKTLIELKADEPGASVEPSTSPKILSVQPECSSTSGVSTAESNLYLKLEAVIITAVDSPIEFTIQKLSEAETYKKHREKIQKLAVFREPLNTFVTNSFCLAVHPIDNLWSRCVILDSGSADFSVSVKCLDDGLTFLIKNKKHLKSCKKVLMELDAPLFGTKCSLPICYPLQKFKDVVDHLNRIKNDDLRFEYITTFKDIYFIELFHKGKNVAETLVEMGITERQFVAPTGHAVVKTLKSSNDFIIQMNSSMVKLNIVNKFTDGYEHREVKSPKVGMLVLGYSHKESCWHRARILRILKTTFDVFFIDQGNYETVKKIGVIEDPFIASIAPVAIRCSLNLPPEKTELTREAEQKFIEIINGNKFMVYVVMRKPGDESASVDLYCKEGNVTEALLSNSY